MQPWELSDGCVLLLRELSAVKPALALLIKHLPSMAELSTLTHFKQSMLLAENIMTSLTQIAQNLGKAKFRPFLDDPSFVDALFRNAKAESQNRAQPAQTCILELGKMYGEGLFRGVLSMVDDSYVSEYAQYK